MRTKVTLVLACLVLTASPGADDRSFYEGVPLRTNYPNVINILDNGAFVVGYDEVRRNPAWAAYRLFANPETFDFDRPSRFSTDARTAARVSHNDYTNSGFSRGHMAPNFAIMTRYGLSAQRATFPHVQCGAAAPSAQRRPVGASRADDCSRLCQHARGGVGDHGTDLYGHHRAATKRRGRSLIDSTK